MRSGDLSIIIPSSLTSESKDQRIKTYKVGQIARAASIFRVDRIIVYKDPEYDDSKFIDLVLRYAETPQYLRKHLFPLMDELKYVGVIPPLRTPHHPSRSSPEVGEYREGVVVGSDEGAWVDIGTEGPVPLRADRTVRKGERVTVRIFSRRPLQAELWDRRQIPQYWGYQTEISGTLGETLKAQPLVIATSRKGSIVDERLLAQLQKAMKESVSVVFGSPTRGIGDILHEEGCTLSDLADYVINTIPNQGTATVRTEEAVFATLSILNLVR
ncbi:MAG: putative RNA uridine N3 methyltransferase [Methanocellales archaeon]|nr:putative RNA uridine N3 methyltransferase [Methanocellales archaeon]